MANIKHIYVKENIFGGYEPITDIEEIEEMLAACTIEYTNIIEDEVVQVHIGTWRVPFNKSDFYEVGRRYVEFIESITGMKMVI